MLSKSDHNQPRASMKEPQCKKNNTLQSNASMKGALSKELNRNDRKELHNACTVDLESHNGLRGLCALWVVFFHNFHLGSYGDIIMLNGSVAMPIFFILSGFSLSVTYGSHNLEDFDKNNFYRNRFARIFPVYIATSILALPLLFTDFGLKSFKDSNGITWVLTALTNILLVNMWILPLLTSFSIRAPSWFASVLWDYLVLSFSVEHFNHADNNIFFHDNSCNTNIFFICRHIL